MQDSDSLEGVARLPGPATPPPPGTSWVELMDLALACGQEAGLNGDVPVGAVVVSNGGQILAKAGNRVERDHDPAGHAEILALREAASRRGNYRLPDCVLVVTLEPCVMCLGALGHACISGVVYGARDQVCGSVHSACDWQDVPLAGRTFWHMGGVRSQACSQLLQKFFRERRDIR